jgi:hypothetical protein
VLLDECVDWRLGRELASHEVKTARQMGVAYWDRMLAPQGWEGARFHILVSARNKTKRSRRSHGAKDKGDVHH